MWLAQIVNGIIQFILSLVHGVTTNIEAYDSVLRVNKAPQERIVIWGKILGTFLIGIAILALLVFVAIKL